MTNQIEGLELIKAAQIILQKAFEDRTRVLNASGANGLDEGSEGQISIKAAQKAYEEYKDLKRQYPAAVAWIRAEAFSCSENAGQRAAAKEAQELLQAASWWRSSASSKNIN